MINEMIFKLEWGGAISQQPSLASQSPRPHLGYDVRISVLSFDQLGRRRSRSGLDAIHQHDWSRERGGRRTNADLSNPASSPSSSAHAFCPVSFVLGDRRDIHIDHLKPCIHISNTFLFVRLCTRQRRGRRDIRIAFIPFWTLCSSTNDSPEWMISIIADALIASKSFKNTLACPRYAIRQSCLISHMT